MGTRSPIEGMADAIQRLNAAFRAAGLTPPVSIELASHDDLMRLKHAAGPEWIVINAQERSAEVQIAGVVFTVAPLGEIKATLRDVAAHLVGAASAYRRHARRNSALKPRAETDPHFTTRAEDFDEAAKRAIRAVQRYA